MCGHVTCIIIFIYFRVEKNPLIMHYAEVKMLRKMNVRILLIDDEKLICSSLKQYLEKNEENSVDIVFNGKSALRKMVESHYDIVLTDLNLPDYKDFELIDEIRNSGKQMPIIVMSAQFPDSTEIHIIQRNIFRCVTKPFELEEISDCVTDAMKCRV
jgi:DNA-binding response OmpR family regulator